MNRPALQLENLTVGYRKQSVLHDVSLEIPRGQTIALLGRNGAGKTTLIRTLLGLLNPTSGSVRVLDLSPQDQSLEVRRRVGYLAEDQTMYGWMTAAEISAFLAPFYPTWDRQHASKLLEQFGVPLNMRIKHLSKGQNIRLGLALALAHRPELVILDDPALGLDPITRKQFNRDVVEHLQAEGRTVFYSSHLLYEVEAVADSVAILDQGKLIRVGKTEQLQAQVKRVILSPSALAGRPHPAKLLDVARRGQELAVTLDSAPGWLHELDRDGVSYVVEDLSLDEIFEAFVIGEKKLWPQQNEATALVL